MENFKNVKTMFIINDDQNQMAKSFLGENDELYGISIFKNAIVRFYILKRGFQEIMGEKLLFYETFYENSQKKAKLFLYN